MTKQNDNYLFFRTFLKYIFTDLKKNDLFFTSIIICTCRDEDEVDCDWNQPSEDRLKDSDESLYGSADLYIQK